MSENGSALMTVEDVAELFAVSPRTIYNWSTSHRIPCVRIGGCLRFRREAIMAWILDSEAPARYGPQMAEAE